jgi:hypothetical protein
MMFELSPPLTAHAVFPSLAGWETAERAEIIRACFYSLDLLFLFHQGKRKTKLLPGTADILLWLRSVAMLIASFPPSQTV